MNKPVFERYESPAQKLDMIFAYADTIKGNGVKKMYFDGSDCAGEGDYDSLMNHFKIGVLCDNKELAMITMMLLRIYIDDRLDWLDIPLDNEEAESLPYDEYMKDFFDEEYKSEFGMDEIPSGKVYYNDGRGNTKCKEIKRKPCDITFWTYKKVKNALVKKYDL